MHWQVFPWRRVYVAASQHTQPCCQGRLNTGCKWQNMQVQQLVATQARHQPRARACAISRTVTQRSLGALAYLATVWPAPMQNVYPFCYVALAKRRLGATFLVYLCRLFLCVIFCEDCCLWGLVRPCTAYCGKGLLQNT